MRSVDEFRDPRIHPRSGDTVDVDLGEGDIERRTVLSVERHSSGNIVRCRIDNDASHVRCIRLRDWQDVANDSAVIDRGLP